eukprot:ANDGO_05276.mRNA.1 hypothetical protein
MSSARVNGVHLMQFVDKDVILLGKCEQQTDSKATIMTSDNRSVVVSKKPSSHFGDLVEVHGKVTNHGTVNEGFFVNLPTTVVMDLNNYNEMVELSFAEKFAPLFRG